MAITFDIHGEGACERLQRRLPVYRTIVGCFALGFVLLIVSMLLSAV